MPLSQWVCRISLQAGVFISASSDLATSQEAVSFSLAGETAAHVRTQNALASQRSGVQAGPVSIEISAGCEVEANDNVLLEPSQTERDLVLRPFVGSRTSWRVSERNALYLAFDAGYSWYLVHDELNRFFIQPGSELSFDVYAGDVWINLHDRFSISQNVYEDPTVTGIGNYSQWQNTAGLSATLDLQKLEINLGYDHSDYLGLYAGDNLPSGRSEVFALNTSVDPDLPMRIGTQLGAGLIHYVSSQAGQDLVNLSAGGFVRGQPMQYVSVEASAGYTVYTDQGASGGRTATFSTFYGHAALHHRLNRYLDYDLSGGRSVSFGFYSGTVDLYSVVFETRVHCLSRISLSAGCVFENGSELFAGGESFDRFGPRLTLERPLGRNFSAELRYQYFKRQSESFGGNYDINILEAKLVYRM